jgi:hypothetical protein
VDSLGNIGYVKNTEAQCLNRTSYASGDLSFDGKIVGCILNDTQIQMIMKRYRKLLAIVLVFSTLLASCVSGTQIQSTPAGAILYADGERVGETPCRYADTKVMFSQTVLVLKKEGYKDYSVWLERDERADVGAIVAGLFVWVPFLWAMRYKAEHHYELEPIGDAEPATVDKPNAVSGTTVGGKGNATGNQNSKSTDELVKLKGLLDQGAITTDDFTTLKVKVLNDEYNYTNSAADQIAKLKGLLDATLLTQDEYNSQKGKVVNGK